MTECIIHTGSCNEKGYGYVRHEGRWLRAHRVAYAKAHGLTYADLDGLSIRHTCDNPPCINPEHLLAGSHTDNMQDKVARGRCPNFKGELSPCHKLTDQQVADIRARATGKRGEQVAFAKEYGVTKQLINMILRGKCR